VCVPIEIERCEEFDPSSAPTIEQLINELNKYDTDHPGSEKLQGKKKLLPPFQTPARGSVGIDQPSYLTLYRLAKDISSPLRGGV